MSIASFVALLAAVTAAALLARHFLGGRPTREYPLARSMVDLSQEILGNRYFHAIRSGDFARPLARVYSQMDMALIESLFSARRVAWQTLFPITNMIRTGLAIRGYNDILLMVLNSEYYRAREILLDYLRERRSDGSNAGGMSRIRNVAEVLICGWAADGTSRLPELLPAGERQSKYVLRSDSLRYYRLTKRRRQSPKRRQHKKRRSAGQLGSALERKNK